MPSYFRSLQAHAAGIYHLSFHSLPGPIGSSTQFKLCKDFGKQIYKLTPNEQVFSLASFLRTMLIAADGIHHEEDIRMKLGFIFPRFRKDRAIMAWYRKFAACLFFCHNTDVDSFLRTNPAFECRTFHCTHCAPIPVNV
jgi:hypothetical protein